MSTGPRLRSAISRALFVTRHTARASPPSTLIEGIPYAGPRPAMPSPAYCSVVGVEMALLGFVFVFVFGERKGKEVRGRKTPHPHGKNNYFFSHHPLLRQISSSGVPPAASAAEIEDSSPPLPASTAAKLAAAWKSPPELAPSPK